MTVFHRGGLGSIPVQSIEMQNSSNKKLHTDNNSLEIPAHKRIKST
jgi:hypothetical protein